MFSRVPIYNKPIIQVLSRRTVTTGGMKKPEVEKLAYTTTERPNKFASSSVKNGNVDQPAFPPHTVWPTFKARFPYIFGGLAVVLGVFVAWPAAVVGTSDAIDHVPKLSDTAAVHIVNGEAKADIPQTYVHLSKPAEDDDE